MTGLPRRQINRIAKERRILDAALRVFAATGYSGAAMDAIAAEAQMPKPTLYQYFGSKEQLFAAMMLEKRDQMLVAFDHPRHSLVRDLHVFAWAYADTVMRPDMLSLARLIIGEGHRFPAIGRAYQASGPDLMLAGIMDYLTRRRNEGALVFSDAELAAQDLWGLILSAPRTQALYEPVRSPDRAALARYVNNGLRGFLRAYSAAPDADLAKLATLTEGDP